MRKRRRTGATTQHVLITHKLPIVFTDCPCRRSKAWIGGIRALCPFPYISIHLREFPTCRSNVQRGGMKQAALDKIPLHRHILRCNLPLRFGGEPRPSPASIRIGLVITDMADRLSLVYFTQPAESHHHPATIDVFPVQRSLPLLRTHLAPALREPQKRAFIASILHKLQGLTICYQAGCELERLH